MLYWTEVVEWNIEQLQGIKGLLGAANEEIIQIIQRNFIGNIHVFQIILLE